MSYCYKGCPSSCCDCCPGPRGPQGPRGFSGGAGSQGPQGPQGATGGAGSQGPQGNTGNAATIAVGAVTSGGPGTNPVITNVGTPDNAVFDFTIPQGTQGPQGATGGAGSQGPQGNTGNAATIAVGTVTSGTPGTNPVITNVGTPDNAVFNFTIPQGAQGPQGPQGNTGNAATIAVGAVTSGGPGTNPVITNVGTPDNAVFDFTIPQGTQGTQGTQGPQGATGGAGSQGTQGPQGLSGTAGSQGTQGPQGNTGNAATIAVGTVTSGGPGTNPVITNVGTPDNAVFNFTIPQGAQGTQGPQGPQGDTGSQGATGPQGLTGTQGPQGDTGPQGATGPQGLTGTQGPQGATGPQGLTGTQGPQGLTGAQGPQGPQLNTFAEISVVTNQTVTPAAGVFLDFSGSAKFGDGSITTAGTNIILPSTGTYLVTYNVNGFLTTDGAPTAGSFASISTGIVQLGVGFIAGSGVAITIFNDANLAQPGDDLLTETALVSVSGIGVDNTIQLAVAIILTGGNTNGYFVQGPQTSLTIQKISDQLGVNY